MKLPTWMTCCDGRGLQPPEDYIGPVVRKRDGCAGYIVVHRLVYAPSPAGGAVEWLRHVGNTLTGPIVPPDDAGFLLDLDRPEGIDAAVRKLAWMLWGDQIYEATWQNDLDDWWFLASWCSKRPTRLNTVTKAFHFPGVIDPREALALALAQTCKEPTS